MVYLTFYGLGDIINEPGDVKVSTGIYASWIASRGVIIPLVR